MNFRNALLYALGLGFLSLAKIKNIFQGYTTPKPFNYNELANCIEYDIKVVDQWLKKLEEYTNDKSYFKAKSVLELGPGSDLGTGVYLLAKGCAQYNACDVNNLMQQTPNIFYECFLKKLTEMDINANIEFLKEELTKTRSGESSKLNYVIRNDFDIASAFGDSSIDIVFSQAAFEHFDNFESTLLMLSKICKPGAVLVAEIDLKTHSRWIRDIDPNNIYRFPKKVYEIFKFRGIPNRLRPYQYKGLFEKSGWSEVTITPLKQTEEKISSCSGLNKSFLGPENQMEYLSIMICAKKSFN